MPGTGGAQCIADGEVVSASEWAPHQPGPCRMRMRHRRARLAAAASPAPVDVCSGRLECRPSFPLPSSSYRYPTEGRGGASERVPQGGRREHVPRVRKWPGGRGAGTGQARAPATASPAGVARPHMVWARCLPSTVCAGWGDWPGGGGARHVHGMMVAMPKPMRTRTSASRVPVVRAKWMNTRAPET